MFVNIQSGIKSEPTVLMTPDKVYDGVTDVLSASDLLALIACVGMEGCSVSLPSGVDVFSSKEC